LGVVLDNYEVVPEAYSDLVDEGHPFSYPPALEDFELQLVRSIKNLSTNTSRNVLFDRCPADYLAYLASWKAGGDNAVATSFPAAAAAIGTLELVIFVPIEHPDRVDFSEAELPRLRQKVDLKLREILIEDLWGFGVNVLEVRGATSDRVSQVLKYIS
jgi:hypothetical protein